MIITKVKYEKLFPTGAYLNEKIGFEADINSTMDEAQTNKLALICIEELRNLAEQSHKEKYPHFYTESGKPITFLSEEQTPSTINLQREKTEIKIDNCTTVDELKELQAEAWKYKLAEQYLNKLQSLKNQNL